MQEEVEKREFVSRLKMCKDFTHDLICLTQLRTGYCSFEHDTYVREAYRLTAKNRYIDEETINKILTRDDPWEEILIKRKQMLRYCQPMSKEQKEKHETDH